MQAVRHLAWRKINVQIFCDTTAIASASVFPPAKCPEQRHFFRPRTASIRGSMGFPIKNPLREKKIPEWKWGRSADAGLPEIDLPPHRQSGAGHVRLSLDGGHLATVRTQAAAN